MQGPIAVVRTHRERSLPHIAYQISKWTSPRRVSNGGVAEATTAGEAMTDALLLVLVTGAVVLALGGDRVAAGTLSRLKGEKP